MEAWFLIDNSMVTAVEDERSVFGVSMKYLYTPSYTTCVMSTLTVGNISIPITVDEKGGNILQLRTQKFYTMEELKKVEEYIYKQNFREVKYISEEMKCTPEEMKYTTFISLQFKHLFSGRYKIKLDNQNRNQKVLFEEYFLYQKDRNGDIIKLYPNNETNMKEFVVTDTDYINSIDSISFSGDENLQLTLTDIMIP